MTRNGPEEHIDHEEAKAILARLCADAGVTVLLCAPVIDAVLEGIWNHSNRKASSGLIFSCIITY